MRLLLVFALVAAACGDATPAPDAPAPSTAEADAPTAETADAPTDSDAPSDADVGTPSVRAMEGDDPEPDPDGVLPGGGFDGFNLIYGTEQPRGAYGDCFIYARERMGQRQHVVVRLGETTTIEIREPLTGEAMEMCPDEVVGLQHEASAGEGFVFRGRVSAGDDPYLLFSAATQSGGAIVFVDESSGRRLSATAPYADAELDPTVTASGHLVYDRYVGDGDSVPDVCEGVGIDFATAAIVQRKALSLSDMDEPETTTYRCLS